MSRDRQILDEISGFEFEQVIADIYRNKGYQNIQVQSKTGDEGKDIIMEKPTENTTKQIIEEFKERYEKMPPYKKALENKPLVILTIISVIVGLAFIYTQLPI